VAITITRKGGSAWKRRNSSTTAVFFTRYPRVLQELLQPGRLLGQSGVPKERKFEPTFAYSVRPARETRPKLICLSDTYRGTSANGHGSNCTADALNLRATERPVSKDAANPLPELRFEIPGASRVLRMSRAQSNWRRCDKNPKRRSAYLQPTLRWVNLSATWIPATRGNANPEQPTDCRQHKQAPLRLAIGHNIADSLGSGVGLPIGVYFTDVFGEASRLPEGFIVIDFLTGKSIA
jgi:hypothetical protein